MSAVGQGQRSDAARWDRSKIGPALVVLVILLLGFGLRVYRLGQQNIWWDEGHAIWAARQSLTEATRITAYDVHPPLYLWLLHGWMRLAGESEFVVRYLSTIGGMLTVALCYVVARRLVGRRAAMLAMLLLATARYHIWWSQEARMYVWATFFVLLSIYYLIRLHHQGYSVWLLYMLSSAAALYTLYLSILAVLLQNIFVACVWWRRPRRWRFLFNWVLAQIGVLVLYAPWVYLAYSRTRTDVAKTSFAPRLVWQLYATVLATGISTHLDRYLWAVVPIVLLALAGIALLILDRRQPQRYGLASWEVGLLLALPLVLPPLVVFGLSLPRGFFYSPKPEARYLLPFAPLFYILLAGTLASFWQKRRWGRIATIVGAVLVLATFVSVLPGHYAGRYLRDEYQTAMATLAAYAQPDDAVLVVSGDRYPVFFYYYHRRFPRGGGPAVYLLPRFNSRFSGESVGRELEPLAKQHPRLWLASIERGLQDPEDVVQPWLDAHRTAVLHVGQGYNSLRLYAEGEDVPVVSSSFQPQFSVDEIQGSDAAMPGRGALVGYDLPTREHRPGDRVNLGLYVRSQSVPLALGVDLVGPEGQVVATQEVEAPAVPEPNAVVRVTAPFAVYGYTTPGRYWAEVYIRGTGPSEMDGARVRLPAGRVTQSRRLPKREIEQPLEVDLGQGQVRFLGYGLEPAGEVQSGTPLTVDLHWQALEALDVDYTVFVHLVGGYNPATGGPVWAQDDSWPLAGGHPTTRWLPGQVVVDRHVVDVPVGTPSGVYQIHVGLYDALDGARLSVTDADQGRIVIGEIKLY